MLKKAVLAAAMTLCLGMALPAFAEVESVQASVGLLDMTWPQVKTDNKAADKMVNQNIKAFMDDFRNGFVDWKFTAGKTWYETKFEDPQLLSLLLSDVRTEGSVSTQRTVGAVYDMSTGDRLPLASFVRITLADINDRLKTGFYRDGDVHVYPDHPATRIPTDFFLNPDGSICLLYQTNEMGSLLEGNVYLRLSPQDISALNAKNPRK